MQDKGLDTCKQDVYAFLRFSLPTNPRLRGAGDSCWKLRLFFRWIVQGREKLIECDIVAFAKDRN